MPDGPEGSYNEALLEARRRYVANGGPRAELLRRLMQEYAQMLVRIQEEAGEGVITEERADRLRANVRREMGRLAGRFETDLETRARKAAELAASGHDEALAAASRVAEVEVAASFAEVPRQALELMMVRRDLGVARTFKTLIQRNVQAAAEDIDRAITSAVARGTSHQRLTKEIAVKMARNDPQLKEALKHLGPKGGRTLEAIEAGIEVPEGQLNRAKRLLFDAKRIAVSELNTAFTTANDVANAQSPVVDLVRWRTSIQHDGLPSSPDVCDLFEEQDLHGYGGGLYHPETVPSNPHPFCQCWRKAVLLDQEDWGSGKRPVPDPEEVQVDEARQLLEELATEGSRSITDSFAKRQTKMLNRHVRLADEHRIPAGEAASPR